jgi:flagellar hook-associated protein 2
MSSTGSISLTGLLGGTAGQIDVTSLISQLMTAATVPQGQLYDQLTTAQNKASIYSTINTKVTALQTAAQTITDPTLWTTTAATSSNNTVVATATGNAAPGATTFDVIQTASAQRTIISADASGNVLSSGGSFTFTDAQGTAHDLTPTTGSATDVAAAINGVANSGVRASVINTSSGSVLQITSTSTGAASAFTITADSGSSWATPASATAGPITTAAQDAQIQVGTGNPSTGGYTVTSSSNTFTNAIPGVTFTVSAPATNVTLTVAKDPQTLANKIQALVDAANTVRSEVSNDTQQGSPLQGQATLNSLLQSLGSSVSAGTATGQPLSIWGIDIDKNGVFSFDQSAFLTAYGNDPAGTQTAMTGFAKSLTTTADAAINPTYGSVTLTQQELTSTEDNLNKSINDWTDRLGKMKDNLTAKFTAMETALASLQSKQTYITSMLKSATGGSSSSSSN